jgi:hypothetical protein
MPSVIRHVMLVQPAKLCQSCVHLQYRCNCRIMLFALDACPATTSLEQLLNARRHTRSHQRPSTYMGVWGVCPRQPHPADDCIIPTLEWLGRHRRSRQATVPSMCLSPILHQNRAHRVPRHLLPCAFIANTYLGNHHISFIGKRR